MFGCLNFGYLQAQLEQLINLDGQKIVTSAPIALKLSTQIDYRSAVSFFRLYKALVIRKCKYL